MTTDAIYSVPENTPADDVIPADADELTAYAEHLYFNTDLCNNYQVSDLEELATRYASESPSWLTLPLPAREAMFRDYAEREDRYRDWDYVPEMGKPDTLCADGTPLLRSGAMYTIVGDWSAGKSWLAAVWAAQEARDGHHVVWLDYEYQARELRERLSVTLGLTAEELRRVHYAAGHDADLDELMSDAEHWHASLIVVDAFTGLHDVLGSGSQNDADKVERTQAAIRPFTDTGATVLVIDHNNRAGESLGSQRKMSGVDAAFTLTSKIPFADGVPGCSEVTVAKPPRDGSMLRGARIAVLDYDGETFEIHGVNDKLQIQARGQMTRKLERMEADSQVPARRDLLRAVTGKAKDLEADAKSEIAGQVLREAGY